MIPKGSFVVVAYQANLAQPHFYDRRGKSTLRPARVTRACASTFSVPVLIFLFPSALQLRNGFRQNPLEMSSTPGLDPLVCEWPEVESGLPTTEQRNQRSVLPNVQTSIDILELMSDLTVTPTLTAGLNHDTLIAHFEVCIHRHQYISRPRALATNPVQNYDTRYASGDDAPPALQVLSVLRLLLRIVCD